MKIPENPPKINLASLSVDEFQDLFRLRSIPEVQEYIRHMNERYYHWDELRHFNHPKSIQSETIWSLVKLSRSSQYRKIALDKNMFNYTLTDSILKELHELDQRGSGSVVSKSDAPLSDSQVEKYLLSSLMEEAIATSQLEGAVTTREVAKEMLRTGKKPKTESEHMIVNAYSTMRFLNEVRTSQLTPELICKIHSMLTVNTIEDGLLGRYRQNNEIKVIDSATNEVVHVPPNHTEIPNLVSDLCKFINAEGGDTFQHPIIKAIILHFMIGYIHPFHDGNGRTARALFYWYVLKKGYWLFEYMPISRIIKRAPARYSRSYIYVEHDDNDLTYFIVFNLRQLKIALREFVEYLAEKRGESEKVKEILKKDTRLKFRQSDIILRFMRHPLKQFTINEIKEVYNVTYETARSDLEFLASQGYCTMMKEGRKFIYIYNNQKTPS